MDLASVVASVVPAVTVLAGLAGVFVALAKRPEESASAAVDVMRGALEGAAQAMEQERAGWRRREEELLEQLRSRTSEVERLEAVVIEIEGKLREAGLA